GGTSCSNKQYGNTDLGAYGSNKAATYRTRKIFKSVSAKFTEMMAEAATFNEFQVTVLVNTQKKRYVEARIEWTLNDIVEASESQLQSVADTSQCMEQKEECQPLEDSLLVDVDVEK
ncbi:hypothetical protein HAX54_034976, partial [Datura stramonium]|nr:hypothetical protein [Datura stramonium]